MRTVQGCLGVNHGLVDNMCVPLVYRYAWFYAMTGSVTVWTLNLQNLMALLRSNSSDLCVTHLTSLYDLLGLCV